MKKISFVIPCFKSQETISNVISEIVDVVASSEYDYEIVAVIDGSPDNVYSVLKEISKNNNKVKVINFSKNYGQASARMAGLKYATGDFVICLDDDGQCPVDKTWDLISPLEDGYDVAIADYPNKKQSAFKNFGSNINRQTSRILLDLPKDFKMTNFYAMKSYIVRKVVCYNNPYPYMTGLLVQITNNFKFVPMDERERLSGSSKYTFKKLVSLWLNGVTNFSIKPLRISSLIGCICALIGFIFAIITIIKKLTLPNISVGWSSLISSILFIGGLIMLMLV